MQDLANVIEEIARTPVLLVATDYDGTLAPIVTNPGDAEAHRESLVALRALSQMSQTHIAVISGRSLADLSLHMGDTESAHLVGSHGSEFESGFAATLASDAAQTLARLVVELRRIVAGHAGLTLEEKPAGVAFHYRNAPEADANAALEEIFRGAAKWPGVHVRKGKMVVELSVVETNKGKALNQLRQRVGATAVIFFGDDVTDEDAFATLSGPDVGIKVGSGASSARFRVDGTADVVQLLATLCARRGEWLAGSGAIPIEKHSFLSDQRTCALVDPSGRIVWLCVPRVDSMAIFAELLGGPTAGYFEICPANPTRSGQPQYIGDTCILQTDWGNIRVIDYLDISGGRAFQRAGRTDLIRVVEGTGRVRIRYAPRQDFGRVETRLTSVEGGLVIEGAVDPCVLVAPGVSWKIINEGAHDMAEAEINLGGQPLIFELRYGTGSLGESRVNEASRREQTARFWTAWANTLILPKVRPDLVKRSALAIRRACTYGPTGAMAAAGTASLPEHAGGVRNWDYRFCWPRDAAMAAASLVRLGANGPATKYLDWVLGILEGGDPSSMIRPVYTVTGGHLGSEAVIAELAGYRGSRPVRVGNAAAHQVQLDVFGPIAELVALLADRGAALTAEHARMVESMVATVSQRWQEADHGIWEVRRARQHHVHSKVMCWVTVDRAIRVAEYLGRPRREWHALRNTLSEDILARGWNTQLNAFGGTYERPEPDASALWVGLSGLLPPTDPRVLSTIELVERELRTGVAVYRYKYDDGLPGLEGGFNICTTWLIEAYAMAGRWDDAQKLFEQYTELAGPTGLIAEEWDPIGKMSLGNFPQAYSHLGLINVALRLSERP